MDSLVQSVLKASTEKDSKYKTTEVVKDIDVDIDEGHLLAVDPNPLDIKALRWFPIGSLFLYYDYGGVETAGGYIFRM